jgi:hypothetical protein
MALQHVPTKIELNCLLKNSSPFERVDWCRANFSFWINFFGFSAGGVFPENWSQAETRSNQTGKNCHWWRFARYQ